MLTVFVWPPLLSSTTTSTSLTPQCLVAAAISFWEPTIAFWANSHLLSFVLPIMKLSNSRNYLKYELMIMNL
jgi:hypothetical protein